MKAKKKYPSIKHKIRAEKERERRIVSALFLLFVLLMCMFIGYFVYTLYFQPSDTNRIEPDLVFYPSNPNAEVKAALIDQLALWCPNDTFVEAVSSILTKGGFTVDYFNGKKVNVKFFKYLPTLNYKLIVLRVHSALAITEKGEKLPYVDLFTAEPYSPHKYIQEQITDQISKCMLPNDPKTYFGISPPFIQKSMNGKFDDSIIILMGCDTLTYPSLAKALHKKGAKAIIGWNGPVLASHTDTATTTLLKCLIIEKQTIGQAIQNTMKEVGPDPAYNSILQYYPDSSAQQTIESIAH